MFVDWDVYAKVTVFQSRVVVRMTNHGLSVKIPVKEPREINAFSPPEQSSKHDGMRTKER